MTALLSSIIGYGEEDSQLAAVAVKQMRCESEVKRGFGIF